MAGRWSDERERGWEVGGGADGGQDREDRSFGRGQRVFGERESGVGYNRPPQETRPQPGPGYRGPNRDERPAWQDRDFGGVSPGFRKQEHDYESAHRADPRFQNQDYTRGGSQGDAGRWPIYSEDYGPRPPRDDGRAELEHRARDAGAFVRRTGQRVAHWFSDVAGEGAEAGRYEERGYRGRGPKGHTRSDERISEDVHQHLTDDPWLDASHIEVAVSGGEVTLSGTVEHRDAKHHAERLVEDLSGVTHVQNNLRVQAAGGHRADPARTEGDASMETSANATHTTTRPS